MPPVKNFNTTVSARTAAADYVLKHPPLLAAFQGHGGLKRDLQSIYQSGVDAGAADMEQSGRKAESKGATASAQGGFATLCGDYKPTMAVLQAVIADMREDGVDPALIKRAEQILKNEVAVHVSEPDAATGKRTTKRSAGLEPMRAEIHKDATALVKFTAIHPRLNERKVTLARLKKLESDAAALRGAFAEKTAKKGSTKTATKAERDAVTRQKARWGSCYRLLLRTAKDSAELANLLAEASAAD